jgi:hypothetical protein
MDEVAVVRAVLASMGVADYDPKVATLLAEYLRRELGVRCVCVLCIDEMQGCGCNEVWNQSNSHPSFTHSTHFLDRFGAQGTWTRCWWSHWTTPSTPDGR